MDMVICKVVNNIVLKAMRYDADSINGDLDILLKSMLEDMPYKGDWKIIPLDTYRHNVESGNWTELDFEEVILSIGRDIWEEY